MENKINFNFFKQIADNMTKTKEIDFGFGDMQTKIKINLYLPVSEKLTIANQIASACVTVDDETGFKREDEMLRQIFFNIYLVQHYTNIEMDAEGDVNVNYNTFQSIGLFNVVKEEIPESELAFLNEAVTNAINSIIEVSNHINSLGYSLKSLIMSLDSDLVDSVKTLKDFSAIKNEQLSIAEEPKGNRQARRSTNKNKSE